MKFKTLRLFYKIFFIIFVIYNLQSCSVKYSFTGASLNSKDKTVQVKYFPNRAVLVNPNLSQAFTESLKDKFLSQTNLELVNGNADLTFEGEIVGYSTKPIAISAGEAAQMNRLTVTIRVKYTGINNEKLSFDTRFTRYADYDSSEILSDVEDDLISSIIEELTDDVFNKSVVNW